MLYLPAIEKSDDHELYSFDKILKILDSNMIIIDIFSILYWNRNIWYYSMMNKIKYP